MTRANARELAVHLIYSQTFTGEEPDQLIAARLDKEYYSKLSAENDVYADRPSKVQMAYIDNVVSGVTNRLDDSPIIVPVRFTSVAPTDVLFYFALIYFYKVFRRKPHISYPILSEPRTWVAELIVRVGGS